MHCNCRGLFIFKLIISPFSLNSTLKIPNSYVPMYTWEQDQVTFRPFSGVGCSAECGMWASEAGDDWGCMLQGNDVTMSHEVENIFTYRYNRQRIISNH